MSEGAAVSPPAAAPDLVYVVRPGDDNDELRYSLRSVVNLSHRKVWIVGHCPGWVRNVERIELEPLEDKFDNQRQSLLAACDDDRITSDFVLMNDDMFVMHPVDRVVPYHLGPLSDYVAEMQSRGWGESNTWFAGVMATLEQLRDWGTLEPRCYEAHVPLPFNRARLGGTIRRATRRPFLWGAGYSAIMGDSASLRGDNVKVADGGAQGLLARLVHGLPYLSTEDAAFTDGAVGEHIRNTFPDPGPYEEAS